MCSFMKGEKVKPIENLLQAQRLTAYRQKIGMQKLEGFLVTREVNIRYLSGFTGDSSWLLVTAQELFLLTDPRYSQQAQQECQNCQIVLVKESLEKTAMALAEAEQISNLGFEGEHVTVAQHQKLVTAAAALHLELIPSVDMCSALRQYKDEVEIDWLRKAAGLGDQALKQLQPLIRPGITERQLGNHLKMMMLELGSEGESFETIVASGQRGALPHGAPTDKMLALGDMITLDFGCVLGGYHSDMTRTFILGEPDAKQRERYNLVLQAQMAAIDRIGPGQNTREIDTVARKIIKTAGFGGYFGHGLGHSVGLEIHESPRFSPIAAPVMLEPGMILTVEPGVYIPGWGGLRIEDMVLITEEGKDILTKFPKTLEEMTIIC